MTGNEYQKLAMRTKNHKATERISDKLDLLKFCKKEQYRIRSTKLRSWWHL
jgi:hypothetical protein